MNMSSQSRKTAKDIQAKEKLIAIVSLERNLRHWIKIPYRLLLARDLEAKALKIMLL